MKKVRLIVSGRVQGVGFRYSTYALALELGDIYGRVWNNDDGTVEILAQSEDSAKIAKFIQEIRKGNFNTILRQDIAHEVNHFTIKSCVGNYVISLFQCG